MPIIHNQPMREYHADPAIGSSTAKLWLTSPRLFKDQIDGITRKKESASLDFGTLVHTRFLQPDVFAATVSEGPINPKTGKVYGRDTGAFAAWQEANPHALVASYAELADMRMMHERMPKEIASLIGAGDRDVEVSYYEEIAGVRVKCRPDLMTGGTIYDLKTIGSLDDAEKHLSRYKYWLSHAWYRMIVQAVTGQRMPFVFLFAERNPPYRWQIVRLDADWIGYADDTVERILTEISLAQQTGDYRDRTELEVIASRPQWDADETDTESEDA